MSLACISYISSLSLSLFFVLIILYSLYLEYDSPLIPPPPGWPARWRSSTPATRRPLLTKERKHLKNGRIGYIGKERNGKRKGKKDKTRESSPALIPPPVACRLLFLRPLPAGSYSSVHFGRELPDISGRQEVHHRLVALLHGEQLRNLHVSASACSPPSRFSHLLSLFSVP